MANASSLNFHLNFQTNVAGTFEKIKKETAKFSKKLKPAMDGAKAAMEPLQNLGATAGDTWKGLAESGWVQKHKDSVDDLAMSIGGLTGQMLQFATSTKGIKTGMFMAMIQATKELNKQDTKLRKATLATAEERDSMMQESIHLQRMYGESLAETGKISVALFEQSENLDYTKHMMHQIGVLNRATDESVDSLSNSFGAMNRLLGTSGEEANKLGADMFYLAKEVKGFSFSELNATMPGLIADTNTYFQGVSEHLVGTATLSQQEMLSQMTTARAQIGGLGSEGVAIFDKFIEGIGDKSSDGFRKLALLAGDSSDEMAEALASGDIDVAFGNMLEGLKDRAGDDITQINSILSGVLGISDASGLIQSIENQNKGLEETLRLKEALIGSEEKLENAAEDNMSLTQQFFKVFEQVKGIFSGFASILEPFAKALLSALSGALGIINSVISAIEYLLTPVTWVVSMLAEGLGKITGWVAGFVGAVGLIIYAGAKLLKIVKVVKTIASGFMHIVNLLGGFSSILKGIGGFIVRVLVGSVNFLIAVFTKGIALIVSFFTKMLIPAIKIVAGFLMTLTAPVWIVIAAVVALIALFAWLGDGSIMDGLVYVWDKIIEGISAVWDLMKEVAGWIGSVWDGAMSLIGFGPEDTESAAKDSTVLSDEEVAGKLHAFEGGSTLSASSPDVSDFGLMAKNPNDAQMANAAYNMEQQQRWHNHEGYLPPHAPVPKKTEDDMYMRHKGANTGRREL